MKIKQISLVILIQLALAGSLMSQTNITLTYTATTNGQHTLLDSILIENITQSLDTLLIYPDTVLMLDQGNAIFNPFGNQNMGLMLSSPFPNPFTGQTTIRFCLPERDDVTVRVCDFAGREVSVHRQTLAEGEHTFTLFPGSERYYLLVVETMRQKQIQKLISLGGSGVCRLEYSGHQQGFTGFRLGESGFAWAPGDQLRFTGYGTHSGNITTTDTIVHNPSVSTMYSFNFTGIYPAGFVHCDPVNPTAIVDVINPITGKIWMDRNLGASQAAVSSTDPSAYGDLYQWGRFADGHQCRLSDTTAILSTLDQPLHGDFIVPVSDPWDWRIPCNGNLWQGVNGVNNPCPAGYRVPSKSEIHTELASWTSSNLTGAYGSPLKFTACGHRSHNAGSLNDVGYSGYYWSSTLSGTNSWMLGIGPISANIGANYRANGDAVRCIKVSTPSLLSMINGEPTPCQNAAGLIYDVVKELDVTYTWAVPSGWNIISGQGTPEIVVNAGTIQGAVQVTPSNFAGTGITQYLAVSTWPCSIGAYPPGYLHCDSANPTAVIDITNPITGKIWMDRNLGASQTAASSADTNAYGDLFQWGRFADGHQCRTSATTTLKSVSNRPGHPHFILASGGNDWRIYQNDNLWQGVNGNNNPCPAGYRIPTQPEWEAERLSWGTNNSAGAVASPLKLTSAGVRVCSNGGLNIAGSDGLYWSGTVSGIYVHILSFSISNAGSLGINLRGDALSVRCIRN